MLEPKDKFNLPHLNHYTSAIKGIDDAIILAKHRYLSSVAAAVDGHGEWLDVTKARKALEEALLARAELQRMWPD